MSVPSPAGPFSGSPGQSAPGEPPVPYHVEAPHGPGQRIPPPFSLGPGGMEGDSKNGFFTQTFMGLGSLGQEPSSSNCRKKIDLFMKLTESGKRPTTLLTTITSRNETG